MIDFDRLNEELDHAGYDLIEVHKIYDRAQADIQTAPPDQRAQLESRLLDLCQKRADLAKKLMDAHMEHLKH
jgi:hypothetical protein